MYARRIPRGYSNVGEGVYAGGIYAGEYGGAVSCLPRRTAKVCARKSLNKDGVMSCRKYRDRTNDEYAQMVQEFEHPAPRNTQWTDFIRGFTQDFHHQNGADAKLPRDWMSIASRMYRQAQADGHLQPSAPVKPKQFRRQRIMNMDNIGRQF